MTKKCCKNCKYFDIGKDHQSKHQSKHLCMLLVAKHNYEASPNITRADTDYCADFVLRGCALLNLKKW